jgi:predicted nucleic acid-binding protein
MIAVLDASALVALFREREAVDTRGPINHLVAQLSSARAEIIVPTPALTEFMCVKVAAREAILAELQRSSAVRVAPFDQRAALECADLLRTTWTSRQRQSISRAKFKFDWMIVSIALTHRATEIYTSDADLDSMCTAHCQGRGLRARLLQTLPRAPEPPQQSLDLPPPGASSGPSP